MTAIRAKRPAKGNRGLDLPDGIPKAYSRIRTLRGGICVKQLRHILYLNQPDIALKVEGQALCAVCGDGKKEKIPFHLLEGIVSFSYAGITPAVLTACAERGIRLSALTPSGRVRFQVIGETRGNVLLRMRQYQMSGQEEAMAIARAMLGGKFRNCRKVLERFRRNHPDLSPERLEQSCRILRQEEEKLELATEPDQFRGIVGTAARAYFQSVGALILPSGEAYSFVERNRRPPKDPCNAMLSFAYALLTRECVQALECVGLDPYVGVLHRERPGKPALALDLMEELRPLAADRFVLRLVNRREIGPDQFEPGSEGGVCLTVEGRKRFLQAWGQWRETPVRLWGEEPEVPLGLLPHMQACQLAAVLRGDQAVFMPLRWKG